MVEAVLCLPFFYLYRYIFFKLSLKFIPKYAFNNLGAIPDVSKYGVFDEIRKVSKGLKCTQLDEFLDRRFHCCPVNSEEAKTLDAVYFRLLVFEMLYLWNALASCNLINVQKIITGGLF